jgi:hypothetical protein
MILWRVVDGRIISSMYPFWAAARGLAKRSRYSFSFCAVRRKKEKHDNIELLNVLRNRKRKRRKRRKKPQTNVRVMSEDDLNGTLGSHDGDLSGWPSVINISAKVL